MLPGMHSVDDAVWPSKMNWEYTAVAMRPRPIVPSERVVAATCLNLDDALGANGDDP